jgi:hypothetical protein
MPGAQSASACGAFHTEVLQSTEREDISNPEAPASRSLTSEFGLPVAGASPRRKNQSEPTSTSPEKSGRTGTSPEQTGVEDTQLARGMSYGLPTLRFQRRSESSEHSVQRHCETLDVVPSVGEPGRSVRRTEAPRFSEGRVHMCYVQAGVSQNRSFATSGSTPDGTRDLVVSTKLCAANPSAPAASVPESICRCEGRSGPYHDRIGRHWLDRPPGRRVLQAALMAHDRPCRRVGPYGSLPLPETTVSAKLERGRLCGD